MAMAKAKRLTAPRNAPLKDHCVLLRFSRAQFATIAKASKRSGVPFAVLVRTLVLQAIEQGDERRLRGIMGDPLCSEPREKVA
jgi:hypothetical protein